MSLNTHIQRLTNVLESGEFVRKLKHIPQGYFYDLLQSYDGELNIRVAPGEADVEIARSLVGTEGRFILI